jgi:hypothetical protein
MKSWSCDMCQSDMYTSGWMRWILLHCLFGIYWRVKKKCHLPGMASSISFWRVLVSVHSPFWQVLKKMVSHTVWINYIWSMHSSWGVHVSLAHVTWPWLHFDGPFTFLTMFFFYFAALQVRQILCPHLFISYLLSRPQTWYQFLSLVGSPPVYIRT